MTDVMDFTPTPVPTSSEIKDFTGSKPAVKFKLDDDVFYGVRDLPAIKALEFTGYAEQFSDSKLPSSQRVAMFIDVIKMLLEPESAERFIGRLNDPVNPIGLTTFTGVIRWLFEQYAGRPTQPGSDSLAGSDNPESGTNSTVTSSVEE